MEARIGDGVEWFDEFYEKEEDTSQDAYVHHKEFQSHFNGKFYTNDMDNKSSLKTFLKRIEMYDYLKDKKIEGKKGFLRGFTSIGN